MNKIYTTKEQILSRAKEAFNLSISEIDKYGRLREGKGAIGKIIEESWFGIKPNNKAKPDFKEAGVELKVIPYKIIKNGEIRAKERLVCNIIDYTKENWSNFKKSSFFKKCKTILIMTYKHIPGEDKGNFKIDGAILFSFPKDELKQIKKDWKKISGKVKAGKAHKLSEKDTTYLAACTKAKNASKLREQPFSEKYAKQRAYALKQSYMTYILNEYVFGNKKDSKVIRDVSEIK